MTNLPNECWVHFYRSATLSKVLKKVESLSNGSQTSSLNLIQLLPDFNTTFNTTFPLFSKKVGCVETV